MCLSSSQRCNHEVNSLTQTSYLTLVFRSRCCITSQRQHMGQRRMVDAAGSAVHGGGHCHGPMGQQVSFATCQPPLQSHGIHHQASLAEYLQMPSAYNSNAHPIVRSLKCPSAAAAGTLTPSWRPGGTWCSAACRCWQCQQRGRAPSSHRSCLSSTVSRDLSVL